MAELERNPRKALLTAIDELSGLKETIIELNKFRDSVTDAIKDIAEWKRFVTQKLGDITVMTEWKQYAEQRIKEIDGDIIDIQEINKANTIKIKTDLEETTKNIKNHFLEQNNEIGNIKLDINLLREFTSELNTIRIATKNLLQELLR